MKYKTYSTRVTDQKRQELIAMVKRQSAIEDELDTAIENMSSLRAKLLWKERADLQKRVQAAREELYRSCLR
jgi:hypothetical protein